MQKCGDCEHYQHDMIGPSIGRCRVTPIAERACKPVKYNTDASKCDKFTPLERVVTDTTQSGHMIDPHIRPYRDYELEKIDVNVDPDKLKDAKYWG